MPDFEIRNIDHTDHAWITGFLTEHWGSPLIVTSGKIHKADTLPGFIATYQNKPAGLITYRIERGECEIVSLNSTIENLGMGRALIEAVLAAAGGCKRVWLITTNDNLHAIEFYKNRGFALRTIYPNAIQVSRKLKPSIPEIGFDGIPIKDELEFEYLL
jgi:hypothetical protein